MNAFNYYFEANIGIAVTVIFFLLFLKKESNFTFMRFFLLTGLTCSLLFPLIEIQTTGNSIPSVSALIPNLMPEVIINGNQSLIQNEAWLRGWQFAVGMYVIVAVVLFSKFVVNLSGLLKLSRKEISENLGEYTVIQNSKGMQSFSFFRWIFIGSNMHSQEEKSQVIAHEIVHVKKFHSADILITEILKVIFWFNPAVHALKNIFISIHEFQADEAAVRQVDVNQYCNLLARVALQSADYPIANHFNNSLTLKRIAMITNAKNKLSPWKAALSVVTIGALFFFISCKEQTKQVENISPSNEVFDIVDESAVPKDGIEEFYKYIGSNLKYPTSARQQGIEGKVLVEFIINKDGSISDVKVLKGIGKDCDEEAAKVISSSSGWVPGKKDGLVVRQKMVIPIAFKLG